jgi:hypothetical protein
MLSRLAVVVILIVGFVSAQAQTSDNTPSLNQRPYVTVAQDNNQIHFDAKGDVREIRLEVFNLASKRVYDSESQSGHLLDWQLQDQQGKPVPDGRYIYRVTMKDSTDNLFRNFGKVSKSGGKVEVQPVVILPPGNDNQNNSKPQSSANSAKAFAATVGGGFSNIASGEFSTIGGGQKNYTSEKYSTVGGGATNYAFAEGATVAGGYNNNAWVTKATVGGGFGNNANNDSATVAGGNKNTADGVGASVGGGAQNTAQGDYSSISGGAENAAYGRYAVVPGGKGNLANGESSLAAGNQAKALHKGSFVWGDSTQAPVTSYGDNSFTVRASGGINFFSNSGPGGNYSGVVLSPGAGGWSSLSDRQAKTNFAPIDGREVLRRLSAIPITTWNYRSQPAAVRHIGPMAQDFYAAFGMGEDNRHINTVDADGVALAAIQGLYQLSLEKDQQLEQLKQENIALRQRLAALEQAVEKLIKK